jgi:hypothetical protein
MDLSRREFLWAAASAAILPGAAIPESIHIAVIYSPEFERTARAAAISAAEVERAARLLRREIRFSQLRAAEVHGLNREWSAVIRATQEPLVALADTTIVDVVNSSGCDRNTYYLRPSSELAVWHGSLERFGAGQLNARLRAAGMNAIDDQSWLGWFAIKCLWESSARARPLAQMQFDGHKGEALVFNRARRLVQPLYRLSADKSKVIAEVPPSQTEREQTCAS